MSNVTVMYAGMDIVVAEKCWESYRDAGEDFTRTMTKLAQLPQLGHCRSDFQVFFRRKSLFIGRPSAETPM